VTIRDRLHPERRWRVDMSIRAVVVAPNEDRAVESLGPDAHGSVIHDWFCRSSEATEIRCDVAWLPENWREACAAIWFGEGHDDGRATVAGFQDSVHWWATNGHSLIRCGVGDPPEGRLTIPPRTLASLMTAPLSPAAPWQLGLDVSGGKAPAVSGAYTIALEYLYLVESQRPTRWEVPSSPLAACAAYDDVGLLALVMPYTASTECADEATQQLHGEYVARIRGER